MKLEEIIKMIEEEFSNVKIKEIAWKELISKLKERGIERITIDNALDETQRRKIIDLDSDFYKWIDPSIRNVKKIKTERYYSILAEIFKEGKIGFLPEEDVEAALEERGFHEEEIDVILADAERDYILDFYSDTFGPDNNLVAGCSWIPPEDRQRHALGDRHQKKWFEKQLEKYSFEDKRWG